MHLQKYIGFFCAFFKVHDHIFFIVVQLQLSPFPPHHCPLACPPPMHDDVLIIVLYQCAWVDFSFDGCMVCHGTIMYLSTCWTWASFPLVFYCYKQSCNEKLSTSLCMGESFRLLGQNTVYLIFKLFLVVFLIEFFHYHLSPLYSLPPPPSPSHTMQCILNSNQYHQIAI